LRLYRALHLHQKRPTQRSLRLDNGKPRHWSEVSSVESGHLAAALKRGGGNNQVITAGVPLIPRSGEPASIDG
jgi:hypothetical protein